MEVGTAGGGATSARQRNTVVSVTPIVPRRLLVCHACTGGACQRNHLGPTEANLATPPEEVSSREVERVPELDQHIERHHEPERVLASRVVDQVLNDDEGASRRQGLVSGTDKAHLLLQIPVVKDHA